MISSSPVELEKSPCPLGCLKNDAVVLTGNDRLHSLPGEFTVVKCCNCGLMRTNPRPTPDTIGLYYPGDYGPYQDYRPEAVAGKARNGHKKWLRNILGIDARAMPPMLPGRLLEIGCASGAYMDQMRRAGWEVEGLEFSEAAAQLARKKGFIVQVTMVESALAPARPFDVVAAWMVLEHLHDPVGALNKLVSWVKPDGYLVASIPDAGSVEFRLFGARWYALQLPTHLYHYTPRSLSAILHKGGWELVRVTWQRNCNNLLWSLEYLARDKKWLQAELAVRWFRTSTSRSASRLRTLLGWVLGVTRQSGRIEIWARPLPSSGKTSR